MYQFRVNKHEQHAGWVTTDGSSFNAALQSWHALHLDASDIVYDHHTRHETPPSNEVEYFLIAFDTTGERYISRMVESPLRRSGGVRLKRTLPTLQELAVQAGLEADALDPGAWEDEETAWS
jgi:hypothetical protein